MKPRIPQSRFSSHSFRSAIAMLWVAALAPGASTALGQDPQAPATTVAEEVPKIPNDQLDSLVAPIALYPDPLLSQTLVAATYPLEVIQLQQWLDRNKTLKGKALADAVKQQNWDPSIQAMIAVPDAVQRLAGNIQWTTELGNAFLAQQADVMDAVQRMRAKAAGTGSLKTGEQQKVETQTVEGGKQVIVIEQASPEVIYVPSYDPVVVYGAPAYPYPSYIYPGYVPGAGLAFGAGLVLGAAWGGGWGYHYGWGNHCVNVNYNNYYINHYNNFNHIKGQGNWQHQPAHRGGAPYGPGGIGGVGGAGRPGGVGGVGGIGGAGRPGGVGGVGGVGGIGGAGKPGGVGGVGGIGGAGKPGGVGGGGGIGGAGKPGGVGGVGGIGGAGKPGGGAISGGAGNRPGGGGAVGGSAVSRPSTLPASRPSGGNTIGGRGVSPGSGYGSSGSAFGGGGGYSGGAARASSSRGASSMGGGMSRGGSGMSRGGGGMSRGGGGMSRGGGGRR